MKLKVTLVGVVAALTVACGGGEQAEIEALIEELARLQALTLEEMERNVERRVAEVRSRPLEVNEAFTGEARERALRNAELSREMDVRVAEAARGNVNNARRRKGELVEGLRGAQADDAWNARFGLALLQITPVELIEEAIRAEEAALEEARGRSRELETDR